MTSEVRVTVLSGIVLSASDLFVTAFNGLCSLILLSSDLLVLVSGMIHLVIKFDGLIGRSYLCCYCVVLVI